MTRNKNVHPLIEQAAEQATALVDQAAGGASTLVDQVAPHLEAARDKVVTEYVPQARKAGKRARKQVVEEYVPQARAAIGREPAKKKTRGRTLLKLLALAAIGTAIGSRLRRRDISPVSMYEAPTPKASESPVPPGAVGEPAPEPEDLQRLEGEAPLTPAAPAPEAPSDSLNTFFEEILDESAKGSRRR